MPRAWSLAAVWVHGISQLRRRWASWLGLVLLVGVAGGFVLTTAAGVRRTTSVYDRLLDSTDPFDVALQPVCPEAMDPAACDQLGTRAAATIRRLPVVADLGLVRNFLLPVRTDDGASLQPEGGEDCFTGSGEVDVFGSPDGRFGRSINRHRFVEGRAADPTRRDEVVLSVTAARRTGVRVGDRLAITPVDACGDVAPERWPAPVEVTVVGLQLSAGEVKPEAGRYLQSVTVTPPLLAELSARDGLRASPAIVVRLRDDATVNELARAIRAAGLRVEVVLSQDELSREVRRGLRPDAYSLLLLAVLGGTTALIVLGQALSRQVWGGAADIPTLRAIGFTDRDVMLSGAVQGAAGGLVAGGLTAALAFAASPLMPIGRARPVEPTPGAQFDVAVVGIGALAVALATFAAVVFASRWVAARSARLVAVAERPTRVSSFLGRMNAPPSLLCGARMALERGHGAQAAPVGSGFIGTTLGMAALVGSLTFGAGLGHLLDTPPLVGLNWDAYLSLEEDEGGEPPPVGEVTSSLDAALKRVTAVDGVARAGYGTFFPPFDAQLLDGAPETWLMSFSTGPRAVLPTVVGGRAPTGPDEILLTRSVADHLGLDIGDPVKVHGGAVDADGGQRPTSATVTVVGTGVFPIGDGLFKQGAALTFEGLLRLAPQALPQFVTVDIEAGADAAKVQREIDALGLPGERRPAPLDLTELVDLDVRQADTVPRVLGTLMAVLAVGVLVHLILTAAGTRRYELATLQALGFRPRQVWSTIAWQATIVTVIAFGVGTLVGVGAGRAIWLAYSERLGVAPATVFPVAALLGFLLAFLVMANAVAALVSLRQLRTGPAELLRSE